MLPKPSSSLPTSSSLNRLEQPPEPPDHLRSNRPESNTDSNQHNRTTGTPCSFKDKLQSSTVHRYFDEWFISLEKLPAFDDYTQAAPVNESIPFVTFSEEELQVFSKPWSRALLIQTVGITRVILQIEKHLKGV